VKKNILALCLIGLLVIVFAPDALAGQYQWQIETDQQGSIIETVSIEGMQSDFNLEGWESHSSEGMLTLGRVHQDWQQYVQTSNGLPVKAQIKNYLLFSTTILNYHGQTDQSGLFQQLLSEADGTISIQTGGIIQEAPDAEIDNMSQNPTAIWYLTAGTGLDQLKQSPVFMEILTFNGLAISLTILLFGFIGITVWYLTYVRRVNKLIEEEYSLDDEDIERLLQKSEEEEKED